MGTIPRGPEKPKTKAIYLPHTDMRPAEYDTIKELSEDTGQTFSLFTLDQHLHTYAIQLQWASPKTFPKKFLVCLGGILTLINLTGATGNLMADTGLADFLSSVFTGVNFHRQEVSSVFSSYPNGGRGHP